MKPSDATIASTTSAGTGASVVTTITASCSLAAVVARRCAADGGGRDVHAGSPKHRADAADHARHVAGSGTARGGLVELQVEALAPRLEQVRAVRWPSVVPTTRVRVVAADDGRRARGR